MTDLEDSLQIYELGLVDFVAAEEFCVVAEVAQEIPAILPGWITDIFLSSAEPVN